MSEKVVTFSGNDNIISKSNQSEPYGAGMNICAAPPQEALPKKTKTSKEVLAMYLGWDILELKEYLYQPSLYTASVYAVGQNYYCAVRVGHRPAEPTRQNRSFSWKEVDAKWARDLGVVIYKSQ